MKKVAISQSNYLPWKGYFDMIAAVDEFIIYDDMQYTRRDWRNRNQIKTPKGLQWLSVPVKVKGKYHQIIRDTEIDGADWQRIHWLTIEQNYRQSPCFGEVSEILEPFYQHSEHAYLSALNRDLIEAVCRLLGITTKIANSWDYHLIEGKTERLADLCQQAGGNEYLSGPAARDYIDDAIFAEKGIKLSYMDYLGYPEYPQLWGEFVHNVSIIDLLFNCGIDASRFMKLGQK